jgi:hypothetical protein
VLECGRKGAGRKGEWDGGRRLFMAARWHGREEKGARGCVGPDWVLGRSAGPRGGRERGGAPANDCRRRRTSTGPRVTGVGLCAAQVALLPKQGRESP